MVTYKSKPAAITIPIITALLVLPRSYTAINKLTDFSLFMAQHQKQHLDGVLTSILIWAVPIAEILVVVLLLVKRYGFFRLQPSLALLILFIAYIGLVLIHFFDQVPCSCGGVLRPLTWHGHLYFNLFFVGINGLAIYLHSSKFNVDNAIKPS